MNHSKYASVASLLAFLPMVLTAQVARKTDVPLKNWATPLYWQPSQAERAVPGRATSDLQFSANAVSTNALTFIAITPCRLVDTRGLAAGFNGIAPFSGPSIAAAGTLTIPVQSATEATANTTPAPCGVIPSIAQAYSLNLTVVPAAGGAVDYVSMWPSGYTKPFVATLDDPQGAIISNAAIVPAGTPTGGISVYNAGPGTADMIIDMNGYFTAPTDVNANTAIGAFTLATNTSGVENTANGYYALGSNTSGGFNTAIGFTALADNTTGNNNTANGGGALQNNTFGSFNTASGGQALQANTAGNYNTASGDQALEVNTTGSSNTAIGYQALQNNTTESYSTAIGANALASNTTGSLNTAIGFNALGSNTSGGSNIAIGTLAAFNASGASVNNIHIGNQGAQGDNSTIKIGENQTSTYIAGISGAGASGGAAVYVTASGQLVTILSSRRFKDQITDMGDTSNKLFQLRPVNFFYKPQYDDGSHLLQYGLIAEEVAKVYPEMVAYDKDGQILTVKYQMLAPMLLNEAQKQNAQLQKQNVQLQSEAQIREEQNRKLEERFAALEALLANQTPTTARPAGNQ